MSECRFSNSNGQSLDQWCVLHRRSASCCFDALRAERDEARGLVRRHRERWYRAAVSGRWITTDARPCDILIGDTAAAIARWDNDE